MVNLQDTLLQSKGISPQQVVNALNTQNVIAPSGTAKIGQFEYDFPTNSAPRTVDELNNVPVKVVGNSTIYLKDISHVADGYIPQTNIVRHNGRRGVLVTVIKAGSASTLSVVNGIRQLLPRVEQTLSSQLRIQPLADQSLFVRAAIDGVVREATIAAGLTALMILLFLGSWRSTVIIAVSIPLAILTSVIVLSATGETINIMTLGGLALAVGILVDDATVEVENINRNREAEPDKDMDEVVLDSESQIAAPAFVSTLSICIVFAPMFMLSGVARYLFVPLAEAVVFAMLASYFLSRTIVPTMAKYLLRGQQVGEHATGSGNVFVRVQQRFEAGFEAFRERYHRLLERCLHDQRAFLIIFFAACLGSLALIVPWLGQDFFPTVDAGSFKL